MFFIVTLKEIHGVVTEVDSNASNFPSAVVSFEVHTPSNVDMDARG